MYIKTIIITVLITSLICVNSFSQSSKVKTKNKIEKIGKDDPKKQGKKPIDYENFELTNENLPWAKAKVEQEKERAENELDGGIITSKEYNLRMAQIARAEEKIKKFEDDPKNNGALISSDTEDKEIEYDPKDAELISKKDPKDKRIQERKERERKKREENNRVGRKKNLQVSLNSLKRKKEKLEIDKKAGIISDAEYSSRLKRLEVSEKNIKAKIEEFEETGNPPSGGGENVAGKNTQEVQLKEAVERGDNMMLDARKRVQEEKAQMNKDLKSGKLSQSDYDSKMIRISRVEKAIEDLEKKIIDAK